MKLSLRLRLSIWSAALALVPLILFAIYATASSRAERVASAILRSDHGDYAAWRARDAAWRARLCRAVAAMIAFAPLARRAATGLQRHPAAAARLLDALGGVVPPQSAFAPSVLGRLLA